MNIIKQIKGKIASIAHAFVNLKTPKKVQILLAVILTVAVIIAVPVYAWFSNQRKAAEMFKVEFPNALYLNAAYREDQVQFDLGGININEYLKDSEGHFLNASGNIAGENEEPAKITKKQYIFSVSGTNTYNYILQMAHTTNNMFTYKVYSATPQETEPNSGDYVIYKTTPKTSEDDLGVHTENPLLVIGDDVIDQANSHTQYYVKGAEIDGEYKNARTTDSTLAMLLSDDSKYYSKSLGSNTNVEDHAVPLYWQKKINLSETDWDANKKFCNYYILEVTWANRSGHTIEDKETDLIYFSVKRTNS